MAPRIPRKEDFWRKLHAEVKELSDIEPILAGPYYACVLNHSSFEQALCFQLANKLSCPTLHVSNLYDVMLEAHRNDPQLTDYAIVDLLAVRDRDPACRLISLPFLYFKGYMALQSYRIAHHLWLRGRHALALQLQSSVSEKFAVDIHPAARLGWGIVLDHGTGIVIGETAVVGNNVSLFHEVTLGGTGKDIGDRHPKVGDGVMIAAGAKIFGNINIGENAKIAGSSVVLEDVPAYTTVAGIPAVIVGRHRNSPVRSMEQSLVNEKKPK